MFRCLLLLKQLFVPPAHIVVVMPFFVVAINLFDANNNGVEIIVIVIFTFFIPFNTVFQHIFSIPAPIVAVEKAKCSSLFRLIFWEDWDLRSELQFQQWISLSFQWVTQGRTKQQMCTTVKFPMKSTSNVFILQLSIMLFPIITSSKSPSLALLHSTKCGFQWTSGKTTRTRHRSRFTLGERYWNLRTATPSYLYATVSCGSTADLSINSSRIEQTTAAQKCWWWPLMLMLTVVVDDRCWWWLPTLMLMPT